MAVVCNGTKIKKRKALKSNITGSGKVLHSSKSSHSKYLGFLLGIVLQGVNYKIKIEFHKKIDKFVLSPLWGKLGKSMTPSSKAKVVRI